jgi:hypothetical protein
MKFNLLTTLTLTILLFACKAKQIESPLTEDEVKAVITAFDNGWQTKNTKLVDSVLSQHYLYFTQSGNTFDRVNLLNTAGSDVYQLQTMGREEQTIQLEGNTAVVNTVWTGKGTYHGQTFNDRQRCSITIVKSNGQVKILAEHCTPIK